MELLKDKPSGQTRRRFLVVSTFTMGGLAALKALWPFSPKPKPRTAKFLTHDGRLVEVDISKLPFDRNVATKEQMVKWVWKDQKIIEQK